MPNLTHRLIIAASAEAVYDALTTSEGLSAWWTPGASATPETGKLAVFPFGTDYRKVMMIEELSKNNYVKWKCTEGADEWIDTEITFALEKFGAAANPEMNGQLEQLKISKDMTLLSFAHSGWKSQSAMFAECNYTWALFLRSLKLYCETGSGSPWPEQHVLKNKN